MSLDFKVSLSWSSPDRVAGKGVSVVSNKLDDAFDKALLQQEVDLKSNQSKSAQATHLWSRLKAEMRKGVERINSDSARVSLVGGKLEFETVDKGYLSDDVFQVKNETFPCLAVKVRNCHKFLAVEVIYRSEYKGDVQEREMAAEELSFTTDKLDFVSVKTSSGQKIYDAEDLSVYLFEKFWNPSYRE
jgi:hypothetical protein